MEYQDFYFPPTAAEGKIEALLDDVEVGKLIKRVIVELKNGYNLMAWKDDGRYYWSLEKREL